MPLSAPAQPGPGTTGAGRAGACCTALADVASCPTCRAGTCPDHTDPLLLASALLGTVHLTADRRAHTLAVGRRAAALARDWAVPAGQVRLWVACAVLHDLGYGYPRTGHHALDGGLWLAEHGAPTAVVSQVAWHSTAAAEARLRGLDPSGWFDQPDPLGRALIWVADFTTSPTGRPVSLQDRLTDIRTRYPGDHPAVRALDETAADLVAAVRLVDKMSTPGRLT